MNTALKEWSLLITSMMQGQHHLMLRKGGLGDADQEFQLEQARFLLFPTWEHQKMEMFSYGLMPEPESMAEDSLVIEAWAEMSAMFKINNGSNLSNLKPLHVWSESYVRMRMEYKPEKPLYLVLLRIYQLAKPHAIPNLPRYGGCRSWVTLDDEIPLEGSKPVISETEFAEVQKKFLQSGLDGNWVKK